MASKGQSNMKYKTMMCKHYKSDLGCQYGEKCQFAHGQEELRMSQGMPGFDTGNKMMQQQKIMTNYKIAKCKNFEKEGQCKYGSHCTFAHGDNDLHSKNDPMTMGMNQVNPMMMMPPYMMDYNMMMNQMQMGGTQQGIGGFPQMPFDYSQGMSDPNLLNMMMNAPQDRNMDNMNLNNAMSGNMNMANMNMNQPGTGTGVEIGEQKMQK